jgi:predicted RNA-binding Zn-ribbon protein involved in translation (DUF1610 family)
VFIGDSTFKTPLPDNVTYGMGYIRYIKSKTETVLSPMQILEISQAIENGRLSRSFSTNRQHVQHVQNIVSTKESETLCPKCGNRMVLRETKKGDNKGKSFWGCATFPKCRAIREIA